MGFEDLVPLVSAEKSKLDILQLQGILRLLNDEDIELVDVSDSGNRIRLQHHRIRCDVTLAYDSQGLLTTLRIIPQVWAMDSVERFYSALQKIEGADISIHCQNRYGEVLDRSTRKCAPAVASLIKLPIAAAACAAAEDDIINLSESYVIREDDISVLSSGLNSSCIGRCYTFEDLVFLMLDHSDNSAMDILLRAIPTPYLARFVEVPSTVSEFYTALSAHRTLIPLTKELYGSAWCCVGADHDWHERALTQVKWSKGYDYFTGLGMVSDAARFLLESGLTQRKISVLDKGGSAPGVISGAHAELNEMGYSCILFAINRQVVFSILEQTYVQECMRRLLLGL